MSLSELESFGTAVDKVWPAQVSGFLTAIYTDPCIYYHPGDLFNSLSQIICSAASHYASSDPERNHFINKFQDFARHEARHAAADASLPQNGARFLLKLDYFRGEIVFRYQFQQPPPPQERAIILCANFPNLGLYDEQDLKETLAEMGLPPDTDLQPFIDEAERRIESWNLPELR